MPKFAANISLLFAELPYLDRFRAASDAGFEAVEILFPYETAAKETQRALMANGLQLVLINAPPPNYTGGARGYAALPDGVARFQTDMKRVMRYCDALRPRNVHVMSGAARGIAAKETFVSNLRWVSDLAPNQQFTIEPLNTEDQPDYFLSDYALAADILDAVDRPNVGLQYDSYHAARIHGDALKVWEEYGDRAVHVQISMPPDRSEPREGGALDFSLLFSAIDATGYSGWISAEYHPGGNPGGRTIETLDWLERFKN